MAGHTPGPWKAIQADLHGDPDAPDRNRWSVCLDGEVPFLIATIENGAPGDTLKTEEANARLFASAPDLLAACKRLLAAIHDSDQRERPSSMRLLSVVSGKPEFAAIEAARAAIARAEGR
jgi:hypothetical protein